MLLSHLPLSEFAETTPLVADFLSRFDRVARFYAWPPAGPDSFTSAAAQVVFPDGRRAALADALREQNPGSDSLELLARPGTCAVVTGQQVGLFTGPAYTIYKALTAARLARRLTEGGLPAVPVFWMATEDHDFEEADECWLFDQAGLPVRVRTNGRHVSGQPVGDVILPEGPLAALREALRGFPHAEEVVSLAADAYAPGRDFGTAFQALLKPLLREYGVLFLDPLRPRIRRLAAPLLRDAVQAAPGLVRLLLERNQALQDAGYHAQVHVEPMSSPLFLLDGGRRLALRQDDGGYVSGTRRFSPGELAGRAADLSPNAVLRPVMQDYILPTVAFVGGPGEVAYMAQAEVLYRELLGRMPVVLPRNGFTLLDSRCTRLLARYGLSVPDLRHGEEALRERIAAALVPPGLQDHLAKARAEAASLLDGLAADLSGYDATLAAALAKSRAKVLYQIGKLERKVAREALRRDARASAEAAYLQAQVYPNRHLQERMYSILPFLARHGLDLVARLWDETDPLRFGHQLQGV